MNIYQKLIEVRKSVKHLPKETKGYQYDYVSSSQVLTALREKMDEMALLLLPRVMDTTVSTEMVEGKDKDGNVIKKTTTYFTELKMEYIWVDADKPEDIIVCPWYGQGVDIAGEKGVGKAMTYAEKYFLLKMFNIATDKDDPDSMQNKDAPKPKRNLSIVENAKAVFNSEQTTEDPECEKCQTTMTKGQAAVSKRNFGGSVLCLGCQRREEK